MRTRRCEQEKGEKDRFGRQNALAVILCMQQNTASNFAEHPILF